jgi:hypothetical protein
LLASKACDITGVAAIACARHGCFVPNAMVDLFKGEQQKNVDFALLKALSTINIDPEQGLLFIYDIVCQYSVHLQERIGHLLPDGLTCDCAIDLFHVHVHKEDCFFRFATTFIPGAAVVAGQILESLWSNLNSISPTVRTATLPHRAEMLDDHACDSNHKKLLSMTETLRSRHLDAATIVTQADEYYHDIVKSVDRETLLIWEKEVGNAESLRLDDVTVMDIYGARLNDSYKDSGTGMGMGMGTGTGTGSVSSAQEEWIQFAIHIEERQ